MVICGGYMFEFSVSKDIKKIQSNNDKIKKLAYFLAYLIILIYITNVICHVIYIGHLMSLTNYMHF